MKLLLDKRENAEKHAVVKGDTLTTIAAHYKSLGGDYPPELAWEDLAMFNWATTEKREVTRALCERIGTGVADAVRAAKDPETLALDPAFGPEGAKEILVPKVWKAPALELKKTHTLKVRKRIPATSVGFTALDKWFIPDLETCEVKYALEGETAAANQLDFEVFGSNYCSLNGWNDGLPGFTALADVPVVAIPQSGDKCTARTAPSIDDFKGIATCTTGLLAKPPGAPEKPLCVAFSPYTVSLRFYKKLVVPDKKARIELQPFWPTFDALNVPEAANCKIKWKVRETARLKIGLIQVVDKDGTAVYIKGIGVGKLGQDVDNELAWDGKLTDGVATITPAGMPYRVQIDAHTDIDEADGLAVSAMHTEVRLFVDSATHVRTLNPYVAGTDRSSLDFSLADVYHKNVLPVKSDGKIWTKYQLAKAGFYPGPVNDGATNAHFESALNEFQRSVPKHGGTPGNFQRLAITAGGDDDAATKAALESLAVERKRPWFGVPATRADHANPDGNAFKLILRNPAERLILWVDDRQWYTDFPWINGMDDVNPKIRTIVTGDAAEHGNLRGGFTAGDNKTTYDERDIARPWIPLRIDFRLLGRTQQLTDDVPVETEDDRINKIRRAIGPIRVDWTFDEIETLALANLTINAAPAALQLPELDAEVEASLAANSHRSRSRTRTALRWALDQMKATHARVDINKTSSYFNAPEGVGGIRPAAAATYFSKPFGLAAESLLPWKAKESGRESVLTVVHDNLGQGADNFFIKRQGRAGVYFHPSRMAGDGYQIRAQVRFDADGDYAFTNLAALDARYPRLPQAQTAKIRLWRKSTVRGYVGWGPINTWTAVPAAPRPNFPLKGPDGFRVYYTACHVHLANELGQANAALNHLPATLFADANVYKKAVTDCLVPGDPRRNKNWIAVNQTFWPWSGHQQFGIPEASGAGMDIDAGWDDLNNRIVTPQMFKYACRISLEIVKMIEKQKGWMRGNVIVEYQTTPPAYTRRYQCRRCNDIYTFVQNSPDAILAGNKCPTPGCGDKRLSPGKLRGIISYTGHYTCDTGGCVFDGAGIVEGSNAGGDYDGAECPNCGPGSALAADQVINEDYRCDTCNLDAVYEEAGAPAVRGSHKNEACPTGCGGQMKSRKKSLIDTGNKVTIVPAAAGNQLAYQSGGVPTPGLPSSSLGNPVGVALNFVGDSDLWGHEMAHNRHFEHTGNAPPRTMAQHDTADNTVENWGLIPEADPLNMGWDRACLMTYATDMPTFNDAVDKVCFCYKCVLKNRGWKLNAGGAVVPQPATDMQDP